MMFYEARMSVFIDRLGGRASDSQQLLGEGRWFVTSDYFQLCQVLTCHESHRIAQ